MPRSTSFLLHVSCALILAVMLAPSAVAQTEQAQQPVLYVSQYKINPARLDSLATLTREYDIPWHDAIAARVPGYQRFYYRHDTGNEYNFVIATLYPDWNYVRGDEIPFEEIGEAFSSENDMTEADFERVSAMFDWAYEGATHIDNIYRPITRDD
jgi:hypothetical protein